MKMIKGITKNVNGKRYSVELLETATFHPDFDPKDNSWKFEIEHKDFIALFSVKTDQRVEKEKFISRETRGLNFCDLTLKAKESFIDIEHMVDEEIISVFVKTINRGLSTAIEVLVSRSKIISEEENKNGN